MSSEFGICAGNKHQFLKKYKSFFLFPYTVYYNYWESVYMFLNKLFYKNFKTLCLERKSKRYIANLFWKKKIIPGHTSG